MYKSLFLIAGMIVTSLSTLKATQITLSNNPDSPGQFTTISAAMTAANAEDTILVQASPFPYGEFYVSKEITVIGPGHHSESTLGLSANFGTITLDVVSSGSKFEGLTFSAVGTVSAYQDVIISSITFRNNFIASIYFFNTADNVAFEGNVITGSITLNNNPFSQMIFRNNLFLLQSTGMSMITAVASPIIVDHNNFLASTSGCSPFVNVNGAIITNNVFQFLYTEMPTVNNSTLSNNLTFLCTHNIPSGSNLGSGNINNQDPLFLNYPDVPVNYDWSFDLHPDPASPLLNAATDGTQIGIFGNNFNFVESGEPWGVPVITSLNLSTNAVPQGGVIQINFNAQTGQ